jgi:2-keto-4-pentenoate hydratase/2-oxohepta-3-ene-1,7-dioic acid hydratase in catechol pathway
VRLARFRHSGRTLWGEVNGDRLTVVNDPLAQESGESAPASEQGTTIPLSHVQLLAPATPLTVVGMAHNTGSIDRRRPPQAFLKPARGVTGPGAAIPVPAGIGRVDAEAELAIVIGRPARHVRASDALDHVLGYTMANDVTARALQESDPLWTSAKGGDGWTPLGPWLVTGIDPDGIRLGLRIGARELAVASTSDLARDVTEILAYITSFMTLGPGDVVLTGAPGEVARIRPGDRVTVHSNDIGELTNPVMAEEAVARAAA